MHTKRETIMKDRSIEVITGLCGMLKEQAFKLEDSQRDLSYAQEDLFRAQENVSDLQKDLSLARNANALASIPIFPGKGKARLFEIFLSHPERMMGVIQYLRDNHDYARTNKIGAIKKVRQLGDMGLKEAKDMVENFLANPSQGPTVDLNPCVDTSCLNREGIEGAF
jgi:hypothetical protein